MNHNFLLILVAFFLQIQFILAEETENQNLSEMQKLLEMKKLMEMQKLLELQKQLDMQKFASSQRNSEEQEFFNRGLNRKHYQLAKRLDLDLENYIKYRSNRKIRKKSNILMSVGGGIAPLGLFLVIEGAHTKINHYTYYSDDIFSDIVTGGILFATGVGLTIGGAAKRSRIEKVITKSGTQLSLNPKIDILNKRYGAQLTLSLE